MRSILRSVRLSVLVMTVTAFTAALTATPLTFGCTTNCNGNEYALWLVSNVGNTYVVEFDIRVLPTYTGNQWTDKVGAVQLKSLGTDITNTMLLMAPVGTWNLFPNELGANGCDGGSNGDVRMCAEAASFADAASFTAGDTLKWRFQFDATSLAGSAELKYLYASGSAPDNNAPDFLNWSKVGDLGSFDITLQTGVTPPIGDEPGVPEASTWVLVAGGLSLIGVSRISRRKIRPRNS
jgi:hypothetical protein